MIVRQNKVNLKVVILGQRNVYGIGYTDFEARGYDHVMSFNASWKSVRKGLEDNVTLLKTTTDAMEWLKNTKITE